MGQKSNFFDVIMLFSSYGKNKLLLNRQYTIRKSLEELYVHLRVIFGKQDSYLIP